MATINTTQDRWNSELYHLKVYKAGKAIVVDSQFLEDVTGTDDATRCMKANCERIAGFPLVGDCIATRSR